MMVDKKQTLAELIDISVLSQVVRTVTGDKTAELEGWRAQPAGASRGAATVGVYGVSGEARAHGERVAWRVILKVIQLGAAAFNPAVSEVDHPIYWKREALAYLSDLLMDLPGGITAPRCFAVEERSDESCWLWLEEVQDLQPARWPLAQFGEVACALGRFNGAYLAGRAIPAYRWLSPPGALRGTLAAFAFVHDLARDSTTWRHPLLQDYFSEEAVARLLNLWETRTLLLDGLDRLPVTLCHKDAFRRNIFALPAGDDPPRLVLIDWAYVGMGEIGLDVADLFGASCVTFGVDTTDLPVLDAVIFDNYMGGLREAGWQGDRRLVRFGFAASAGLKYGGLLLWLGDLADPERSATWEELSGQPIEHFVQHQASMISYLLDLVDEAHGLLSEQG
jgi:hypothetical protein